MHNLCFFIVFSKITFTENYFLIAAVNLATRGPLYTCLVFIVSLTSAKSYYEMVPTPKGATFVKSSSTLDQ